MRGEPLDLLASVRAQFALAAPGVAMPDLSDAILGYRTANGDHHVWEDIDGRQSLYIVDTGFAYRFCHLTGGKRHIDDVYGPGAICNWTRLNSPDYRCNLVFKSGSRMITLDPARVKEALNGAKIALNAFQKIELGRTLRVSQRVRALISLPASHRIAIYLLDVREEFRLAGYEESWLPFRLTQEEIADVTGMTEVHVNRTMAKMEQAGELARKRGEFCLPNAAALERQLHYMHFLKRYQGDDDEDRL